jgi:hypothetical protein
VVNGKVEKFIKDTKTPEIKYQMSAAGKNNTYWFVTRKKSLLWPKVLVYGRKTELKEQ